MNTANDVPVDSLTPAQEFSKLISNILGKEFDFITHKNIEVLHDFRVDIRKLRTWLAIMTKAGYHPRKLQKHSLHCHNMGSELRNFDVLIHWAQQNTNLVSSKLFSILTQKRKKLRKIFMQELAHSNALKKIQTSGRNFITHIKDLSKEDLEPHVRRFIEKKIESVNRILPTACDNLALLHEMRKLFKKIRYSLQLLPVTDLKYLNTLKEIQDILGYINDRRVWIALIKSNFKKNNEINTLTAVLNSEMNDKIDILKARLLVHNLALDLSMNSHF